MRDYLKCELCPRRCGIDRTSKKGFCGQSGTLRIARAGLHFWEEPCISGRRGSGTVFFSGCTLRCCFCQNYEISQQNKGFNISINELADIFLDLQEQGAHNINLVSPTQFAPSVVKSLDIAKPKLKIPVVYNCGGYERIETVKMLDGYVDVWLPDLKYFSPEASKKYSLAEDYFEVASEAVKQMQRQVGKPVFDKDGILQKGVLVRHLLLPTLRHDSADVIRFLGESFEPDGILVSVMSQYTPMNRSKDYPEINRRVSTFEYNYVLGEAQKYGFDGYSQERDAATQSYVPPFEGEKIP